MEADQLTSEGSHAIPHRNEGVRDESGNGDLASSRTDTLCFLASAFLLPHSFLARQGNRLHGLARESTTSLNIMDVAPATQQRSQSGHQAEH